MLSSLGRIVSAVLRFAIGAGLALTGAGILRHDPGIPAVLVRLAMQPPFGELLWSVVALAAGLALMLHALPSPWQTDRVADRGGSPAGTPVEPAPEPAPPVRRSFDAPLAPPLRWQPAEIMPPVPSRVDPDPSVEHPSVADSSVRVPSVPVHSGPVRVTDPLPVPVFRSRPPPRRPSRARVIGPFPS